MPRRSLPRGSLPTDVIAGVLIVFVVLLALFIFHPDNKKRANAQELQHTIYPQHAPSEEQRYQTKLREALHRRYEA